MRHYLSLLIVSIILITGNLLLAGCNRAGDDLQAAIQDIEGPHVEVTIRNIESESENEFDPAQITIETGTTVVWINQDSAPHSVTEGTPGDVDSDFDEEILPGAYTILLFDEPGVYSYYDRYMESSAGEITVQEQ